MSLDIYKELALLPTLSDTSTNILSRESPLGPLQLVSKQGRQILKISASTEALSKSFQELADLQSSRDVEIERLTVALKQEVARVHEISLKAVQIMDALDWTHESLIRLGQETFARDVEAAQQDCLNKLSMVGIAEIPAKGILDGNLHEALGSEVSSDTPQYHITKVIRRGFQSGKDVLRRAGVVTAI